MQLPILHVAASFLAATLLFAVQPWAAKMLLPTFGGSASVWLTSLLFFQVAVLAGYGYARLMTRAPRRVHVTLLLAAAVLLPIEVSPGVVDVPPVIGVLGALFVGLGAVLVLVSATTPLLHHWLAGNSESRETYALYAASNAGSLFGLLAYPLLVEPWFDVSGQELAWRGMSVFVVIAIAAAASVHREVEPDEVGETSDGSQRSGRWFVNAFVPASLLYGFTAYLTRDIAAAPLLWVVPLAVYLLTFILAFSRWKVRSPSWFSWVGAVVLFATTLVSVAWPESIAALTVHLVAFAAFAIHFHGELAAQRPPSSEATRYYLWVAGSGVAAGVFNTVLAPLLFEGPFEYALTYGLALVLLPTTYGTRFSPGVRRALYATMMIVLAATFFIAPGGLAPKVGAASMMALAFVCALAFPALAHVMFAIFLGTVVIYPGEAEILRRERSFYGAHMVERRVIDGEAYLALTHGRTEHGFEVADGPLEPIGYYHHDGPCAEVFGTVSRRPSVRAAIVGLGIGSMSLYGRPGDRYTYFELDPAVVELARQSFRALETSEADVNIVVKDGRLGLQAADETFDLIVIDAFSSDAVPTHLLTTEAFELYEGRLASDGLLLLHTSNRFLDIDRVAVGALDAAGWTHRHRTYSPSEDAPPGAWPSSWVVAAPPGGSLDRLGSSPQWQILRSDLVWTDSYSSVVRALR